MGAEGYGGGEAAGGGAPAFTLAQTYLNGAGVGDSTLTLDATRAGLVVTAASLTGVKPVTINHTLAPAAGAEVSFAISGNFAPASGTATYQPVSVSYTINQTGGANGTVTGLLVNATETAVVGTHRLLDLQVAGASKCTVTNAGRLGSNNAAPDCAFHANTTLGASALFGAGSMPSVICLQGGAGTFPGMLFGASSSARGRLSCDDSTGVQLSTNVGTLWLFAPGNSEFNLTNTQAQLKPGGTVVLHATTSGIFGSTTSSGNLVLGSTSNATKGFVQIGGATGLVYDETNKYLGVGVSPSAELHISKSAAVSAIFQSTSGAATFQIKSGGAGNNAQLLFEISAGQDWMLGNKQSDGSFRLSNSTALGTTDVITVSSASGGNATLTSTGHATKGQVQIGGSTGLVYDETNKRLGIGISPTSALHLSGSASLYQITMQNTLTTGTAHLQMFNSNSSGNFVVDVFGPSAGGTSFGIANASNVFVYNYNNAGSILVIGNVAAGDVVLCSNNVERMRIDAAGNVTVGSAALATSATDGFLYIPTCAGAPTGSVTAKTGRSACVYDTTNHKFWHNEGGTTWKGVVLT